MALDNSTFRTRHLVDPEVVAVSDAFAPLDFSRNGLAAVRDRLRERPPGTPDPADVVPGVERTEYTAPGLGDHPDVRVLCYRSRDRGTAAGGLVWIHGGGFVTGTADDDELICRRLALETGAVVVAVDYRLAPETRFPGALYDCYAALKWLHDNTTDLRVNPDRIAVGGESAGGGLAACLATLARDDGECPIAFQLLIYPMLDDRTVTSAAPNPYTAEFVWTPDDNRFGWAALLGHDPGGSEVSAYAAAARVDDVTGLPPTFLSVGALDLFLDEDIAYAQRLLRGGVPTELHVYPGVFHGFHMVAQARVTKAYFRDLSAALGRHLNG